MRHLLIILIIFLLSCSATTNTKIADNKKTRVTETEILSQLDSAFNGTPTSYFPEGGQNDIKYNFFLDLEHPYCITANSCIHLYGDSIRWAIVFEKSGYETEASDAEIELDYVGNCINYPIDKNSGRNYITNASRVNLITADEYEKIRNKEGSDMEQFEFINPNATEVNVRNLKVPIDHDPKKYAKVGIKVGDSDNPKKLIGYGDLIRYLNETDPKAISATEDEIGKNLPGDLPKILTINKFHFNSIYDKNNLPSKQETYQLIAKVLVSRDTTFWKPTLKANNHWTNWESVNL